jgi:hypothetical protein
MSPTFAMVASSLFRFRKYCEFYVRGLYRASRRFGMDVLGHPQEWHHCAFHEMVGQRRRQETSACGVVGIAEAGECHYLVGGTTDAP